MEELKQLQFAIGHDTEVFSIDAASRQVELEVAVVLEDLDPLEKEAREEELVQSVIKASLQESEDHVIETNSGDTIRQMDIVLSKVLSADTIRRFKVIYGPSNSNSIEDIQEGLEHMKVIQATIEPIRLSTIFATLDSHLTWKNE